MSVPENILSKIAKLLSLSSSDNEHEAAAAAAAAQKLMFQHNVDQADIEGVNLNADREVVDQEIDADYGQSKAPTWRWQLLQSVANTSLCHLYHDRNWKGNGKRATVEAHLIGRKADIEIAKYTYQFLAYELDRLSKAWMANQIYYDAADSRRMRRSWLEGAVSGVRTQLVAEFEKNRRANEQSTALVVNRNVEIQDYIRKNLNLKSSSRSNSTRDGRAYQAGRQTGSTMPIRRGISSGSSSRQIR